MNSKTTEELLKSYTIRFYDQSNTRNIFKIIADVRNETFIQYTTKIFNNLNVDSATGVLLDIVSRYIGFKRFLIAGGDTIIFTWLNDTKTTQELRGSWKNSTNPLYPPAQAWITGAEERDKVPATDEQFRPVLKQKILYNKSNATFSSINKIINNYIFREGNAVRCKIVFYSDGMDFDFRSSLNFAEIASCKFLFSIAPVLYKIKNIRALGVVVL
jgi:hypothetical protein